MRHSYGIMDERKILLCDMMRCDIRIPVKPSITPWIQHQNMMEIIDQSAKEFTMVRRKKSKELTDPSINEKRI
jgi:hypothetical protein